MNSIITAVFLVANAIASLSTSPLLEKPLPMAYLEAVETVIVVPEIRGSDVRANGALLPGQRAEVFAVVGDGYEGEIWLWVSPPNGLPGWVLCEGRAVVVSRKSGEPLGNC